MSAISASAMTAADAEARDGFITQVTTSGIAYAVVGCDGLAAVAAPHDRAKRVRLVWSDRAAAMRWAPVLAEAPEVVGIELADLLVDILPVVDATGDAVGPDWSDRPAEPVMTGRALATLVRRARAAACARVIRDARQLWVFKSGDDFASLSESGSGHSSIVPVFATASDAAAAAALFPGAEPVRQALAEFLSRGLLAAIAARQRFAPGYLPGPDPLVLAPWDLKGLLQGRALAPAAL